MGGWNPQLDELLAEDDQGRPATQTLLLDNRGVGRSSIPVCRSSYTSTAMAMDVLCILVGNVFTTTGSAQYLQILSRHHKFMTIPICCRST